MPPPDFSILANTMPPILKIHFKDTHREKATSNKTLALRKRKNMGVWAVGTLNQLCIHKRFLN